MAASLDMDAGSTAPAGPYGIQGVVTPGQEQNDEVL